VLGVVEYWVVDGERKGCLRDIVSAGCFRLNIARVGEYWAWCDASFWLHCEGGRCYWLFRWVIMFGLSGLGDFVFFGVFLIGMGAWNSWLAGGRKKTGKVVITPLFLSVSRCNSEGL
jgi:hypothetical protein